MSRETLGMRTYLSTMGRRTAAVAFVLWAVCVGAMAQSEYRVQPFSGRFILRTTDVSLRDGAGVLELRRSLRPSAGALGAEWRHNWDARLILAKDTAIVEDGDGTAYFTKAPSGGLVDTQGERLRVNPDGTALRIRRDGARETFDVQGRLARWERGQWHAVARYDAADRVAKVVGKWGAALEFAYDAAGQLTAVATTTGDVVACSWQRNRLAAVAVNHGPPARYAYDNEGRLLSLNDPLEGLVTLTWDSEGRVQRLRRADGSEERYAYGSDGRAFTRTDAVGATTRMLLSEDGCREEIYDARRRQRTVVRNTEGQVVLIRDFDGVARRIAYDALGRVVTEVRDGEQPAQYVYLDDTPLLASATFPDGARRDFRYDDQRRLVAVRHNGKLFLTQTWRENGLLASVEGVGQPPRKFEYNAQGRLAVETDALGQAVRYEYDARGNVIRRIDAAGGEMRAEYDKANRVTSVTDPTGAVTRYAYDAAGRLLSETDALGGVTRLAYDARGRRISETDPAGRTTRYAYDPGGRLLSLTDPAGSVTRYEYDAAGDLLREATPLGGVVAREYNTQGFLVKEVDPAGGATQFVWGDSGQLARKVDADGGATQYAYDKRGLLSSEITPAGRSRYERDGLGRVTRFVAPRGGAIEYGYGPTGDLLSAAPTTDAARVFEYDALGRVVRERRASGLDLSYTYDALGDVTAIDDNLAGRVRMAYDALGRLTSVTGANGGATRYAYDAVGNLITVTDPLDRVTVMTYTAAGELASVTDATGDRIDYAWDAAGRLAEVKRGGQCVARYAYDALGNTIAVTDAAGGVWRSAYDKAGRLTGMTDPAGATTAFAYDESGRVTTTTYPDGAFVKLAYDKAGRIALRDDGRFPIRYEYDAVGRLTCMVYPAVKRTLGYTYNDAGLMTRFTDSEGAALDYAYDRHHRLTDIALPDGGRITFAYDARDRVTGVTWPNGVRCERAYDGENQLVRLAYVAKDGAALCEWRYDYDKSGQLTGVKAAQGRAVAYSHDAAGRLLSEQDADGKTLYLYQPGGNRKRRVAGRDATLYAYDAADRILKAGAAAFRHDAAGNLIERAGPDGVTRYAYDGEARLTRVTLPDGKTVSYDYAPTGERMRRSGPDGATYFVTDGANLLATLDKNLNCTARFVHAPGVDQPLMMWADGKWFCYHLDGLGSVAVVTDSRGAVRADFAYDAFGNIQPGASGGSPSPFAFTAREFDPATGLYYLRARYYDPRLGRFLTEDPVGGDIHEPDTFNPYLYCLNRPTALTDPMGLRGGYSGTSWRNASRYGSPYAGGGRTPNQRPNISSTPNISRTELNRAWNAAANLQSVPSSGGGRIRLPGPGSPRSRVRIEQIGKPARYGPGLIRTNPGLYTNDGRMLQKRPGIGATPAQYQDLGGGLAAMMEWSCDFVEVGTYYTLRGSYIPNRVNEIREQYPAGTPVRVRTAFTQAIRSPYYPNRAVVQDLGPEVETPLTPEEREQGAFVQGKPPVPVEAIPHPLGGPWIEEQTVRGTNQQMARQMEAALAAAGQIMADVVKADMARTQTAQEIDKNATELKRLGADCGRDTTALAEKLDKTRLALGAKLAAAKASRGNLETMANAVTGNADVVCGLAEQVVANAGGPRPDRAKCEQLLAQMKGLLAKITQVVQAQADSVAKTTQDATALSAQLQTVRADLEAVPGARTKAAANQEEIQRRIGRLGQDLSEANTAIGKAPGQAMQVRNILANWLKYSAQAQALNHMTYEERFIKMQPLKRPLGVDEAAQACAEGLKKLDAARDALDREVAAAQTFADGGKDVGATLQKDLERARKCCEKAENAFKTIPREGLRVSVTNVENKPVTKVQREATFIGVVDRSSIPAGEKLASVQWTLTAPGGQSGGPQGEGLTLTIKISKNRPLGKYTLAAVATTDKGRIAGRTEFEVSLSDYIAVTISEPCYTGQWSKIIIEEMPFEVPAGSSALKLEGLGRKYEDKTLWKLDAGKRSIGYRPLQPGMQEPTFSLAFQGDYAKFRGTVNVLMTMLDVRINWKKTKKVNKKEVVPFTVTIPGSFVTPFGLTVTPETCVVLDRKPRKSGDAYTLSGHVLLDEMPEKLKEIRIDLVDKTEAVAMGVIPCAGEGDCVCAKMPSHIRAICRKYSTAKVLHIKNEAQGRYIMNEMMALCNYCAGLKDCRHLTPRARKWFADEVRLIRACLRDDTDPDWLEREGNRLEAEETIVFKHHIESGFLDGYFDKMLKTQGE